MRDVLKALAAGEIDVNEAEAQIAGYLTGEVGRFDVAREQRRGIPEGILADGKTPEEVAALVTTAVDSTGHAIVTRVDGAQADATREQLDRDHPKTRMEVFDRARVLVAHGPEYHRPTLDASVGIVTGGTTDANTADEATVVIEEMGARVTRYDDVGVANLTRITDRLPELRELDVIVAAAGREGALPTVVAGLVSAPVIGLPVRTGYGHGGSGAAALAGMLQSCTVLSVVNIDAGYVAGVQAGLIARAIDEARRQ